MIHTAACLLWPLHAFSQHNGAGCCPSHSTYTLSFAGRSCYPSSKSGGSEECLMSKRLQWQLLQQLPQLHPSTTLPRVSGTSLSVHSVLRLPKSRPQLPVASEAARRRISGMGLLLIRRARRSVGRLQRYARPVLAYCCCAEVGVGQNNSDP